MEHETLVARRGIPLTGWTALDEGRVFVAPSFPQGLAAPALLEARALCAPSGGETIRATPSRRTSKQECAGEILFRKVHFRGFAGAGLRDRLRLLLARPASPARLELSWNRTLAHLDFFVPDPVLLVETGRFGASALVTRAIPGGEPLHRMTPDLLTELAGPVACLVASLHRLGLFHRDLYLDHFLLDPQNRLWLTDLQRLIRPLFARNRWRVKDLAALLHSARDKAAPLTYLRFLTVYAFLSERSRQEVRRLAGQVQAKQRRMAAHRPRHDR